MKKIYKLLSLTALSCMVSVGLYAQVQNDVCANATTLTVSPDTTCNSSSYSLDNSQDESGAESCGQYISALANDVWFKFTATTNHHVISANSQEVGLVAVLYSACGGTAITCANPRIISFLGQDFVLPGITTVDATSLTAGNDYLVRVYAYSDTIPTTANFDICVTTAPAPPANDVCANAVNLTVNASCVPVTGTLLSATEEAAADSCAGAATSSKAADVWYKFTASGPTQIITVASQTVAAAVVLYNSCGGAAISCANPAMGFFGPTPGTTTLKAQGLTTSNTYFIRVYNHGSNLVSNADFDICVVPPPPAPANDICSNAISLSSGNTCTPTTGTVAGANEESVADSCAGARTPLHANDVWYKFTANATSHTITVAPQGFPAEIILYSACGGTAIACKNPQGGGGGGGPQPTVLKATGLSNGTTYFVRVYSRGNNDPINGDFDICVTNTPPPPANDECTGAIDIAVAKNKAACTTTTTVNTVGATQGAAFAACSPTSSDDDVWYSFTANDTSLVVKASNYTGGIVRFGLSIYEGACNGTESNCRSSSGTGDSIALHNLITGTKYYLEIFSNGAAANGTFDICVYSRLGVVDGINDIKAISNSIAVQPNPAKDRLNVSFNAQSKATIRMISVSGQVVYTENATSSTGKYDKVIDLSDLNQGVYFLQITTDKETVTRKVVKE